MGGKSTLLKMLESFVRVGQAVSERSSGTTGAAGDLLSVSAPPVVITGELYTLPNMRIAYYQQRSTCLTPCRTTSLRFSA